MPTCYLAHDPTVVEVDGHWYRNFQYVEEARRGLDCHEDLFSPLVMKAMLGASSNFSLIASTEPHSAADVPTYRCNEVKRCGLAHYNKWVKYGRSDLIPILEAAADQFIVTRAPRHTVVAGYHWFGDWGRDTMIALPGLLLATDRPELARTEKSPKPSFCLGAVWSMNGGMLRMISVCRSGMNSSPFVLPRFQVVYRFVPTWRTKSVRNSCSSRDVTSTRGVTQ
jgi:hypothetical protein